VWHIARAAATAGVTVPACVGGVSLAARWGGGAYWLVPTVVLGVTGAMYSAWVLLVEIMR
jgi:hypothetical protein